MAAPITSPIVSRLRDLWTRVRDRRSRRASLVAPLGVQLGGLVEEGLRDGPKLTGDFGVLDVICQSEASFGLFSEEGLVGLHGALPFLNTTMRFFLVAALI